MVDTKISDLTLDATPAGTDQLAIERGGTSNFRTSVANLLATSHSHAATDITSGILPDATMPNLTGDVTTIEGAVATTITPSALPETFAIALSDETTVLGTASTTVPLATFHIPVAFTVTGVKAGLTTAGTGAALITVDIHEAGTTILSTKITIDATEKTSATAATAAVISDSSLAVDSLIECFLDLRDTDNVATGLKVYITGYRT